MKKRKSFLGIYLIVALVLVISAVVVSLTVGINLGTDMVGGSQLEVVLDSKENIDKQIEEVKDVLKANKVKVETIFVEDKNVDTVIVARINQKDIENVDGIRSDVKVALGLSSIDNVSTFYEISGSLTNKSVIWASITIVCLLLAIFIAGWVRYGIPAGLSATFSVLLSMILSVALLILVRLPINLTSVVIISIGSILVLCAMIYFFEKIKENTKHESELIINEIVSKSRKQTWFPLTVFAGMLAFIALVFVFVPVSYVLYTALTILVTLVVSAVSYIFIGTDAHSILVEIKEINDKSKLSKNNSPAPQKVKTKKDVDSKEVKVEDKKEKKATKKKTSKNDKLVVREKKVKTIDKIQV